MPNLTISLDEALLRAAKIYAARKGTSVSRIVRDHLAEVTGLAAAKPAGDDWLARFSRDEVGRREVMRALGVDYGTLIEMMAARGLPLPALPEEETDAMAATFARVWRSAPQR